ncbi:GDSL-type esterase/lipase family protein [Luteolibacter arcticus]|uniref:GDSL-type esterase/lipase family protein n=1 Tax=Luteolibacter arcticus TaxID=1581411 RepID=A0ABT3GGN6_9BACT|nr:GDSL-type esterase/lipase family protein [Luteolibacter arcticus]MCW1922626.1 GDSL-type esterase/lipase family protein [Luteolibacter arcticus]
MKGIFTAILVCAVSSLLAGPAPRRANPVLAPVPKLEEDGYDWNGRHEAIVREQKAINPDLVFVGDSLTHAWGGVPETGLSPQRRTGEAIAAKAFAGHRVLNCGFGWDRTQNVLWRLDHGELDGIQPKTVVVNIGTNNTTPTNNAGPCSPAEIAEGVLAVCDRVRAKCPATKIVLMEIFPRWTPGHPGRAVIAEVNKRLAEAVKARSRGGEKIVLRDLAPALLDDKGEFKPGVMAGDKTHLAAGGYEAWAKLIADELK